MPYIHTTIIGAGQAGLALSRCLTDRGIEHVMLERGAVGQRWRSERPATARLLTPNWMSRLPGYRYQGEDPDGFMTMPEVADFLARYARSFDAPVQTGTTVAEVSQVDCGFRVRTDRGDLRSRHVVVATGACDVPRVPGFAARAHPGLTQVTPPRYRGPDDVPAGGVLVVGASATGVQLAAELRAAGRRVVLAVGRHIRLPRTYRGRDIHRWLDLLGLLRRPARAGSADTHSVQLVGSPERRDLDLGTLQRAGVLLTGRLLDLDGTRATFAGDLPAHVAEAEYRLARVLARVDAYIRTRDWSDPPPPAEPVPPVRPAVAPRELDLTAAGITSVIWATGYRRRYPWLRVPVLRADGEIAHRRGITTVPGLYALGLPLQSRRNSTFLDGVGYDARYLARCLAGPRGSAVAPPSQRPPYFDSEVRLR